MVQNKIQARLEYLRGEIQAERISLSEIAELQSLAKHIDSGDVQLLEWAGVKESTKCYQEHTNGKYGGLSVPHYHD